MILYYLFSVGGFCVLALAATLWLFARPHATAPRRWLIAIVLFYCASSIRIFPWIASRPLVAGYQPFQASEIADVSDVDHRRTVIVLLGSGSLTVYDAGEVMGVLDLAGAMRTLEAWRAFHLLGSPTIISSGGAVGGFHTEPASRTMRAALVGMGVPADRIVLESDSMTTHDEAVLIEPMLRDLRAVHVVLVTSDIHMRRSMATFRAAGINAVPAIAPDPLNSESRIKSFIPTFEGLSFTSHVAHEYAGLVYYWLRGWARF